MKNAFSNLGDAMKDLVIALNGGYSPDPEPTLKEKLANFLQNLVVWTKKFILYLTLYMIVACLIGAVIAAVFFKSIIVMLSLILSAYILVQVNERLVM